MHVTDMPSMIQIRHVPDPLHRELKSRAAQAGMSLSDYLLAELRRMAEVPTREEIRARIMSRPPIVVPESAEEAIRAERDAR